MTVSLNERSWAIDVITEINLYLAQRTWHVMGAGGEHTLRAENGRLFPDVLIYSDRGRSSIVHGWELKLPDTAINDEQFIINAIEKAKILNRNTFLLWNVQTAVLYVKSEDRFIIKKQWPSIAISSRAEVATNRDAWLTLLRQILSDLNQLFTTGEIEENAETEILSIEAVIDVILKNINGTVASFAARRRIDPEFDANLTAWWLGSASEYGFFNPGAIALPEKLQTLSKVVLTDWVFKIIFANVIKRNFNEARAINDVTGEISVDDAMGIISGISTTCNFWNIFSENLGQRFISTSSWRDLVELNEFIVRNNIGQVDQQVLQNILEDTIVAAKRKVAGQFATPVQLADILVRLTIDDKTKVVLDPCCGTGTIINQAFKLKMEYEVPVAEAIEQTWASDKYSFPIQLATITLSSPETRSSILNIFNKDVIELQTGQAIRFRNPNTGAEVSKDFPPIDYVVSNLPFIKSKTVSDLSPEIRDINDVIRRETGQRIKLTKKSDIFVYIPFYLHGLLADNGKVGLVLSNAWLGTDYGEVFLKLLQMFYEIQYVVVSGNGRWFHNADIVTTLLVLKKRTISSERLTTGEIKFVTLLSELSSIDNTSEISSSIIRGRSDGTVQTLTLSREKIAELESFGLPWNSYFADLSWLDALREKIVKAHSIFDFIRGERRGWNRMFYPSRGHGIEAEYIKPVVKNLKRMRRLSNPSTIDAFSCSLTIAELTAAGHTGAIAWIRSFQTGRNESGVLLTESLARPNMHWYEMGTESMADFVANLNYADSLFICRLQERSFIDQRLIGLSMKPESEAFGKDLLHALLNSIVSMFFIESMGFGRGLGGLDLNKGKFTHGFCLLDPSIPTEDQKAQIIAAFNPLMGRNRLKLEEELASADRKAFETLIFDIYRINDLYEPLKASLLSLHSIRSTANVQVLEG